MHSCLLRCLRGVKGCLLHRLRGVRGGFLSCLHVADDGILRRVAGIVVSRPVVMNPAVGTVVAIPAMPVGTVVIVNVIVIVRVGIIG